MPSRTLDGRARRTRLALESLEERCNPNTYSVTTVEDDGIGSLRQAVKEANAAAQAGQWHTIQFVGPAFVGPDVIAAAIHLNTQIVINSNLTFTGPAPGAPVISIHGKVTSDGGEITGSRAFTISSGWAAQFIGLTISDGAAVASEPTGTEKNGGVFRVEPSAHLILRNSTVAVGFAKGNGGNIWVGAGGTLELRGSWVSGGRALLNGGGVAFENGADFTAAPFGGQVSHVRGNRADGSGGGVWLNMSRAADRNRVSISSTEVDFNTAGMDGGGLYINWSVRSPGAWRPVQLTDNTVEGNTARGGYGGGLYMNADGEILRGSYSANFARLSEGIGIHIAPNSRVLRQGAITEVENARYVPPAPPPPPPDPDDMNSAEYIGPGAEVIASDVTDIAVGGAGGQAATQLRNAGLLDISGSPDPRGIGHFSVVGDYFQDGTGVLGIDLGEAGYDQLEVSGAPNLVSLAGGLALYPAWSTPPAVGTTYTIIRNDTDQAVSGEFAGYPHGYEFWLGGAKLRITYHRSVGDPNDVILEVVTPPAIVSGRLFDDGWEYTNGTAHWDRNGLQTGTEGGYAGVVVQLVRADGTVATTTQTGTGGYYSFTNVTAAGSYRIRFFLPTSTDPRLSYRFTAADQGSDDSIDSDADATTDETSLFVVALGNTYDQDAGVIWRYDYYI